MLTIRIIWNDAQLVVNLKIFILDTNCGLKGKLVVLLNMSMFKRTGKSLNWVSIIYKENSGTKFSG